MANKTTIKKQSNNDPTEKIMSNIDHIIQENAILKEAISNLNKELSRLKEPPLLISSVEKTFNQNGQSKAIIKLPNGNSFYVNVPDNINVSTNDNVLCEQRNLNIIRKIEENINENTEQFVIIEKPKITWDQIGGLNKQQNEIQEVVELPLLKPELFRKVGIEPPKGVLLYGPPGTGKTLLAKAVANASNCTFIEIVGSELVQKFIGEGAKLIKSIFQLARKKAPAIIFIDEIDAIAAKRIELGTSGEREVQRTFMQLLAEVDGFKNLGDIKIIGATNRLDILDDAIIRPGRLDRLIEVDLPDEQGRLQILNIHTKNMNFDKKNKVNFQTVSKLTENMSGAEIKSVCTEAGYFAIREDRSKIKMDDFLKAINKIKKDIEDDNNNERMFG